MTRALPRARAGLVAALAAALLGGGAAAPAVASAPALPAAPAIALPHGVAAEATDPAETDDAEPPTPTTTWAVQPADADGPDGRRWVELTLDPGETVTEHLAVRNFSDEATTFTLSAADGYLTDNGRFNMLGPDEESVDAGTWIDVQETVEVPPGETVVVPFTVTVPAENVTPGDHPAGIAASITSSGGTVGVQSRVGFRVMTRVTGEIEPVLTVPEVRATYTPSWNPFAPGDVTVTYDVANEGNVQLGADADVSVSGLFGLGGKDVSAPAIEAVLPGGTRDGTVEIGGVWPLGRVSAEVTLTPTAVGDDEIDAPLEPVTVTATAWAIPLPQLLLVAVVVVLVLGIRDDRRRRRERLERMLEQAREEARTTALAATGTTASAPGPDAERSGPATEKPGPTTTSGKPSR